MKTNKIWMAALAFVAAASCTNLDVDVDSQYTTYPDSPIALEAKMSGVYFHLKTDCGLGGRRFLEAFMLGSDAFTAQTFDGGYNESSSINPAFNDVLPSDQCIDWCGGLLSGITKCNKLIVELGGEKDSPAAVAPARVIRAFFHYFFMDNFGDAPILNKVLVDGEECERQPRKVVAEWIEKELLESIPYLTTEVSPNTYGKPNKWVAEALLAKLYINWPVYMCDKVENYDAATAVNEKLQECIDACDAIMGSQKFGLGSMWYLEKFGPNNGPQVEDFIYAMPYDAVNKDGNNLGRFCTWKKFDKISGLSYYGWETAGAPSFGGNAAVTPEYIDRYFTLEGDDRNLSIVVGDAYVRDLSTLRPTSTIATNTKGNPIYITKEIDIIDSGAPDCLEVGNDDAAYSKGAKCVKWFVGPEYKDYSRNQNNDIPVFRYADILLTKAEALVRKGDPGADGLIDQLRVYAKAPRFTGTATLDDVFEERSREMFAEIWRRNDLIRNGHFEDEWFGHYHSRTKSKFDKWRRIFPVHVDVLNSNPNWKQNAGY